MIWVWATRSKVKHDAPMWLVHILMLLGNTIVMYEELCKPKKNMIIEISGILNEERV